MSQATTRYSFLSHKCQKAFRTIWIKKGFTMNAEIEELLSKPTNTQELIQAVRECTFTSWEHNSLLSQLATKLKIAKASMRGKNVQYPKELVEDLLSTFAVIGSDIFYKTEEITMGRKPEDRPLTKTRAKAFIMAQPAPKAKATTKETFTLASRPLDRIAATATQNVTGAFPTPLNAGHRNLSLVNMAKYGTAVEGSQEYDPDEDPDLEVVEEEEVDWDMVSDGGKE